MERPTEFERGRLRVLAQALEDDGQETLASYVTDAVNWIEADASPDRAATIPDELRELRTALAASDSYPWTPLYGAVFRLLAAAPPATSGETDDDDDFDEPLRLDDWGIVDGAG